MGVDSLLHKLPYKLIKGTIRIDTRTRIFCQLPVFFIIHDGRAKGPEGTTPGFDRVDQAALFRVKKDTEPVRPCLEFHAAMSFFTEPGNIFIPGHFQKTRDFFNFPGLKKNAAFTITAFPAHFTFKCSHNK